VDVVGGVVADLPDAGVRLGPAAGDPVREATHGPPGLGVETVAGPGEQPGRVEHPTVAVELVLVGGAVADPDRPAVGVAGPAVELALGSGVLAVEGEQHGQPGPVEPGGVQQPGHELAGLRGLPGAEEGADPDAGVAGPGEAVVPVADAAGVLGQRAGEGGDGGAGWRVGEQAQGQQAANDRVALGQVAGDLPAPAHPAALVAEQDVPSGFGIDLDQRLAAGDGEHDGQRTAGRDRDPQRPSRLDRQAGRGLDRDGDRSPLADQHGAAPARARRPPVLPQAGVERDRGVDRTALGREAPDEHGGGQQPAGDLGDHALGQDEAAGFALPGGLEGRRPRPVAPQQDPRRRRGTEPEAAGFGAADQAGEQRVAVEARHAQPVDGSVRGDQRAGASVADEPVVGDRRQVGHLSAAAAAGRARHRRRGGR
jgi:hypothetical protein